VGDAWRTRWDSLRLFTLAKNSRLPGLSFPAPDDHFPTKDEMAEYLEAYAERFDLPVQLNTTVSTLTQNGDRYLLDTDAQCVTAESVVVAIGPYHHPNIPAFANDLDPSITQFHSSRYRNPDQLSAGDVLVVGTGNSGAEIAVELAATDRTVWLSGRDVGDIPLPLDAFGNRLVNGLFSWLTGTVLTTDTWAGRTLKKRFQGGGDPRIRISTTDIREAGIEWMPRTEGVTDGTPRLDDGRVLDVTAVVWATGFHPDYTWIEVPGVTLNENGYPIHDRGVIDGEPGLYVLGLPYQYTPVSALIRGVGTDARYIAECLRMRTDSQ
jgi:putative flavoprotein involved in K+ transport